MNKQLILVVEDDADLRAFIRSIHLHPEDAKLVQAIIALAHTLDLPVVAEGVEELVQLDFLRNKLNAMIYSSGERWLMRRVWWLVRTSCIVRDQIAKLFAGIALVSHLLLEKV